MKKILFLSVSAAALLAASIAIAEEKGGAMPGGGAGAAPAAGDFSGGPTGGAQPGGGAGVNPGGAGPSARGEAGPSTGDANPTRLGPKAEQGNVPGSDKATDRAAKEDPAKEMKADGKNDQATKDADKGAPADNAASGAGAGESGKASPGNSAGEMKLDPKSGSTAESKPGGRHVTLNDDQRTRVNSAFKGHRGNASANVKVDVRVGVRLPSSVTLVGIPGDVLVVVPDWRPYRYVIIGDTVCIVDPVTFEIIDVIALV